MFPDSQSLFCQRKPIESGSKDGLEIKGIQSRIKAYVKVYCVFRVSQLRTHLGLALSLEESLGLVQDSEFELVKLWNMETPVDFNN